jgi:hypothetical protein
LTDDFRTLDYPVMVGVGFPGGGFSFENGTSLNYSGSKSWIIGPMLELELPKHLSVEADALYRPRCTPRAN